MIASEASTRCPSVRQGLPEASSPNSLDSCGHVGSPAATQDPGSSQAVEGRQGCLSFLTPRQQVFMEKELSQMVSLNPPLESPLKSREAGILLIELQAGRRWSLRMCGGCVCVCMWRGGVIKPEDVWRGCMCTQVCMYVCMCVCGDGA